MNQTLVIPASRQGVQTGASVEVHALKKEAECFYLFVPSSVRDYDPFKKAWQIWNNTTRKARPQQWHQIGINWVTL